GHAPRDRRCLHTPVAVSGRSLLTRRGPGTRLGLAAASIGAGDGSRLTLRGLVALRLGGLLLLSGLVLFALGFGLVLTLGGRGLLLGALLLGVLGLSPFAALGLHSALGLRSALGRVGFLRFGLLATAALRFAGVADAGDDFAD